LEPESGLIQPATQLVGVFSAGLEARLYVSQDGRRYIFRQALDLNPLIHLIKMRITITIKTKFNLCVS
jgi:hypothetical protein